MDEPFLSRLLADGGIDCALDLRPARLDGWRRGRVRGASYPGLEIHAGAVTEGRLLRIAGTPGVDPTLLDVLDDYEGELYERIDVSAVTPAGLVSAQVYALKAEYHEILEAEDWSPQ